MEFLTTLQHRFRRLRGQMQRRGRDTELIDETRLIENLIEEESSRLNATGARLPTKAVTDLTMARVPEIFHLEPDYPYQHELTVTGDEIVPLPTCLRKYLVAESDTLLISSRDYAGSLPPGYSGLTHKRGSLPNAY